MAWFDRIAEQQNKSTFKLNLRGNMLQCTCLAINFLEWILTRKYIIKDTNSTCLTKDSFDFLNNETLTILKQVCFSSKKTPYYFYMYGVLILALPFILICFKSTACQMKKMILRRTRIQRLLKDIRQERFRYNYLIFIVFSSTDEVLALEYVYRHVSATLNGIFGTNNRQVVCVGDKNFRPGHSIFNETYRCLQESASVVALVSRSFCESDYCCNELEQAVLMQKPVLLLFSEFVAEDDMPPIVKQIFRRNVRAKAEQIGDEVIYSPSIKNICLSVMELIN